MRIENYVKANEIDLRDKLLGTSYLDGNKTKNFAIEDLIAIVLEKIADPNYSITVQADWNENDDQVAGYIKNKPDIYTLPSGQFYRTKGFSPTNQPNEGSGLEAGDVLAGIWNLSGTKRYSISRFNGGDENNFEASYSEMIGWHVGF
ncbi:hypothetical protein [Galbibacter sp. BG1]